MPRTPRTTPVSPGQTAGSGSPPDPPGSHHPTHLAARAARWSVRHRKLAVIGWLVGIALAMVLGNIAGTDKLGNDDYGVGEQARAEHTLHDHGFVAADSENILIQRRTPAADEAALLADPQIRAALADITTRVRDSGVATGMRAPLPVQGVTTDPGLVSHDRRSVLLTFDLKGDEDHHASVDPTLDATAAVQKAHPGVSVEQFGDASSDKALGDTVGKDFHRAELLAIPLTLGILLAVFGAVVAAVIPMGLALTAFIGSLGLVALISKALPTNDTATSVMLLIGLAVGVDYALFYIRREREERAAGHGPQRALQIAADTSGHTILTSGLTVAVSMAGLLITGMSVFSGIAIGTILVVLVAVLGSLTALPALLSMLGDRVELLRLPWRRRVGAGRAGRRGRRGRRGAQPAGEPELGPQDEVAARHRSYQRHLARPGVMGRLLRRPAPVAAITGGLLLLLALPALGMHTAEPGVDDIPKNLPIMKTYDRLSAAFPGGQVPAVVVVSTTDGSPVTSPAAAQAIDALRTRAVASGRMFDPVTVTLTPDRQAARVAIPLAGSGTDDESIKALHTLRGTVIPETVKKVPNLRADVTGMTAGSADFNAQLKSRTPLVIGFVMVLAFALLLAAFRNALVAAVAVGLNLLSVGAAYGLLVAVFQHHWADGLLGYTSTGAVTNWLPLMLFVILFGLSMDYQVFVLSRVKEAREDGLSMREAATVGVRRSAGVVTSAAVIMVAVFSIFATLSQVSMKQLGVGLGAAILLDATLIRVILMPAVLTLLGERIWTDRRPGPGTDLDDRTRPNLPAQPVGASAGRIDARYGQAGEFSYAAGESVTDRDPRPQSEPRSWSPLQPHQQPQTRPRPDYPTPRWTLPPA
ncbi:putative RND superfamily drug exporter [Frankia canadensis]|uniref:Putative RND superfamily drug exporter n=1 Tax=Frankia canadensis TaxID=1836972 RepID=A0A2I2KKV5_9ACTN|nr:MMPL family transporter [Frankia canadensis]SNQ46300.1 putative RND superfamily drug exporter [Frankia canadensis]SOU53590.1 putative RND superfamily drug exporter [Frankia canadensis]